MTMTRNELQSLFRSPFRLADWHDFLHRHLGADHLRSTPQAVAVPPSQSGQGLSGTLLGEMTTDNYRVGFFDFAVPGAQVTRRRVGLRNLLVPWLRADYDAALVVFHSADPDVPTWRVSFICDLKGEETAAKRYSFVFGDPAGGHRTAVDRFAALPSAVPVPFQALRSVFSVEALSKEFYSDLFAWYLRALSPEAGVTFPNDPETSRDDRENLNGKIIRLITRLLFVWFIRQKNLVPSKLFDPAALQGVLKRFDPLSRTSGDYYNAILQNLFFGTLNTPVLDDETGEFLRRFATGTEQQPGNLYRYGEMFAVPESEAVVLFSRVPYMNGGLFECLDKPKSIYRDEFASTGREMLYDGFSRNAARDPKTGHFKRRAHIPNFLFFDPDEREPGLFTLLNRYNFTVEENATNDADVSLDPELLGRVFENLLASYNPETQVTARNATGSFYTPREIVDYMVKESLDAYMAPVADKTSAEQMEHLFQIKVLDPACGSGAFPMGMLHAIVERAQTLAGRVSSSSDAYAVKLRIIENCIFGVDIQSIAMMITKLRFFISLICEQGEPDWSNPRANYGVNTLPNLETKFVAANTLIAAKIRSRQGGLFDAPLEELKKELFSIREQYTCARKRGEKFRIREKDKAKCREIHDYLFSQMGQVDQEKLMHLEQELAKAVSRYKELKNPDWQDASEQPRQQELFPGMEAKQPSLFRIDANEKPRKLLSAQISEIKKQLAEENAKADDGNDEAFIEAVEEITRWTPYDQVAVSPFFDPEWMFGVKDGFDIVIGNPPYIRLENNRGELANLYAPCNFETFARTGDIYCLFYERGWQLLKDKGHLCFITSNKWMRAGYGEKLRKFFAEKTNPRLLVDFAGEKIFEAATVDTNILLFQKGAPNTGKTHSAIGAPECRNDLSGFVSQRGFPCPFTVSGSWVILSPIEQDIKAKIEAVGTPLKDWDISINYGIKTGCNEAFIIGNERREEILSWCKNPTERKRTEELIRPILRGRDIKRYGYDWANLYILALFPARHYNIEDFPSIKRHLLSYAADALVEGGREDLACEPFLSQFCQSKLEQSGKVIRIAGRPVVLRKRGGSPEEQKARKRTANKWFEVQDTISYWDDFSKPKIVWMDLSDVPTFAYDVDCHFSNNTVYFMSGSENLPFLLGYLNSKMAAYLFSQIGSTSGVGTTRWQSFTMERLLVPQAIPAEKSQIAELAIRINEMKANRMSSENLESEIDAWIYRLYGLTEKEIFFIEHWQ